MKLSGFTSTEQTKLDDKVEIAPNIYLRDSDVGYYIKTLYYIEDGKAKSLLDYYYKGDDIFISEVISFHPYKSKGYATKLLKQLIKLFPDRTLELYVVPGFGVNAEYLIDWYKGVFGFEVVEGYEDGLIVDDEVIMKRHPTNNLNEQTNASDKIDKHVKRIIGMYAPNNLIDQYTDLFYEYLDKYMAKHKSKYNNDYDYLDKVKQLASVWIQSKINLNLFESRNAKGAQKMEKLVIAYQDLDSTLSEAGEAAYEKYGDGVIEEDIKDALEVMYQSGILDAAYTPEELKDYVVAQFPEISIEELNEVDWDSLFHKLTREENYQVMLDGYFIEVLDLQAILEAYL